MKRMTLFGIAVPAAILLLAAAPTVFSDDHDKKTDITIDKPIQVPGAVLQPGKYMFILMNSASDRHIVEIKSEDGSKLYATTFTTAAQRRDKTSKVVLTFYEMPEGTPDAVRQWFWPGDVDGQEFLYSHQKAAEISAASHQTVPELTDQEASTAAAPVASETGAPETAAVTASAQQSIDQSVAPPPQQIAEQPPVQPQPSNQDQVIAQVKPPADNFRSDNDLLAQNSPPAPAATPAPVPARSDSYDSASLPKTASDLPLIGLIGSICLVSAFTLRLARRA